MLVSGFLLNTSFALFCGYTTHLFMLKYAPFIYNMFLYTCFTSTMYCYTQIEFHSKNMLSSFKTPQIITQLFGNRNRNKDYVSVIKSNNVIFMSSLYNIIEQCQIINTDYDFIVMSVYEKVEDLTSSKENKVVLYKIPSNDVIIDYEKCDYKFISMFIKINEEKYQLTLLNEYYNYYVSGNVLNELFFCYLLKTQHNIDIDKNDIKYMLELIDHNINIVILHETDELILGKSEYNIRLSDYKKEVDDDDDDDEEEEEEEENYDDMPPLIDIDDDTEDPTPSTFVSGVPSLQNDSQQILEETPIPIEEVQVTPSNFSIPAILVDLYNKNISNNIIFNRKKADSFEHQEYVTVDKLHVE